MDKRPFHVIDGKGFQHLLKELSPSYKIPCATILKQLLDNKYDVMKQTLKVRLSVVLHVSLTFDVWTETMTEKSFLGITIQFLEKTLLN